MNLLHNRNIIALSKIEGIGPAFLKKHLQHIRAAKQDSKELSYIGGKDLSTQLSENLDIANSIVDDCQTLGITIRTIADEDYPESLLEIKNPPPVLYLLGNITVLNKALAIIGTRKSTPLGNKIAYKVAHHFSTSWSICNGLVEGIDKHSIIDDAQNVLPNVIGVLSGGLNYTYTSSKITQGLAEKVLKNNGLLISESEPHKKEDQFSGSKASRIQAGLSKGLIIIQSSETGGSKYTLKTFSELNRPLGVVYFKDNPEFSLSDHFSMNRALISRGLKGLQMILDSKDASKFRVKEIFSISGSKDYLRFEEALTKNQTLF